jgi:hypothetical protein
MKSSHASAESPAVAATTAYTSDPDLEIEETDIRVLSDYVDEGWGPAGHTLVGLGPPSSRSPVVLSEPENPGKPTLRSEPPGPWGSDGEEGVPRSLRPRKAGIWAAVVPLFVVFTAIVVFALRGLAPSSPRAHASAAPAVEPSTRETAGVFVKLSNPGVLVSVDGVVRGAPPVLLMYLDPGSHVISIAGPGFARYEQTVTLVAGNVSTLEPVLESETIDLDTVKVTEPPHAESAAADATPPHASGPASLVERFRAASTVKPVPVVLEETPENPYPGMLAASSTPSAMLVVDGRPLGQSPRAVDLQPGIHTVVFVHPELGRKSMTVSIWAGKTTNVAVDF